MVDRAGGTPVFCSPEGLTGTTPGVSDMFSLGRLFTFLVMKDKHLFYSFLFSPILDSTHRQAIRNVMRSFPILELIEKMTDIDQIQRAKIPHVESELEKIKSNNNLEIITRAAIEFKLTQSEAKFLHSFVVDQMMKESKYICKLLKQETKLEDRVPAKFQLNSQLSKNLHDQGNAAFCWSHAISSMIRRSLKKFYKKHKDDSDLNLKPEDKAEIEKWLDDNKFHSILEQQIRMNPIPKQEGKNEGHGLLAAIAMLAYPTALDGPGIHSLEQVTTFFNKMNLSWSKVDIKEKCFSLKDENDSGNQDLVRFVELTKLCPVMGAYRIIYPAKNEHGFHTMVVDKAEKNGSRFNYHCKNSWGGRRSYDLVTHTNYNPFFRPKHACVIYFEKI